MYITPMTAENMTAKEEMTDKVLANIVYEASADGGTTWTPSEKTADERYVIKGLEPSTTYTIRSRFGGVLSSNTQTVTTESAQQVENGDMETYSETEVLVVLEQHGVLLLIVCILGKTGVLVMKKLLMELKMLMELLTMEYIGVGVLEPYRQQIRMREIELLKYPHWLFIIMNSRGQWGLLYLIIRENMYILSV